MLEQTFISCTNNSNDDNKKTYKIISFNIMADCFSDYTLIDDEHKNWQNRINKFKELITKLDPDILALQEVDKSDELEEFMKNRGYDVYFPDSKKKKKNKNKIFNMMFIKNNIEHTFDFKQIVPKEFDNGFSKIIISDLVIDNNPIRIINLHLKARLMCENIRLAQLDLIKEYFTDCTIVLGDFNALPDSNTILKMKEYGFESVYPLDPKLMSFSCRTTHETIPDALYHTEGMFDYIFYNNKIKFVSQLYLPTIEEALIKFPKYGLPHLDYSPSDHLMIGGEFYL